MCGRFRYMIIRPCDAFIDFKGNTASLEEWKNYAAAMNFLIALEQKDNLQIGVEELKHTPLTSFKNEKAINYGKL